MRRNVKKSFSQEISKVVENPTKNGAIGVSGVADSAANVQKALRLLNERNPKGNNSGCTVHLLNRIYLLVIFSQHREHPI